MRQSRTDEVARNLLAAARRRGPGLSEGSPFSAGVARHARATALEVDIHRGMELGILLRGEEERVFQDMSVTISPGEVWLCAMWEPHGWRATVPGTQAVVSIFLPEYIGEEMLDGVSCLAPFAAPPAKRPRVTTAEMRRQLLDIGREMDREVVGKSSGWESALRICILRALLYLIRQWKLEGQQEGSGPKYASGLSRLMPVLEMMHADPARQLNISQAASLCGMSRSRFTAIFRQTMSVSFAAFRMRTRLAFTARRLLTTHDTVARIAADAGFVDASHLHRAFVKHYQRTPRQFREQRI